MLKILPINICYFSFYSFLIKKKKNQEMNQNPILIGFDSRLFRRDMSYVRGSTSNGSWVGSNPHGRPMPITQHLPLAHDGLVLFHISSQKLKQRVLFIQVKGLCDLKHIDGGSSNTNLLLGHIGDINLIRVRQCLFTSSIFHNTHD